MSKKTTLHELFSYLFGRSPDVKDVFTPSHWDFDEWQAE